MGTEANGAGLATAESTATDEKEVSSTSSAASSTATNVDGTDVKDASKAKAEDASVTDSADELKDFLPEVAEEDEKSNVQKRIDKLTAQLKQLKEENEELKNTVAPEGEKKKTRYTPEQLKGAISKAMQEQDHDLLMEVIQYAVETAKEDLRTEYTGEITKEQEVKKAIAVEWSDVLKRYDYLASPNQPELYAGARKDLDLKNQKSLLFRLAAELYTNPQTATEYRYKGGQRQAVADALTQILRKKTNPSESGEALKLKKQLDKERMKNSFAPADAEGETSDSSLEEPQSHQDKLAKFIADRKKYHNDRSRGTGM
jgi:hypothetical protein